MPRRAGKAATRRARQRNVPRSPARPTAPTTPVPPVGTPDAREAVSLDPPRRAPAPAGAGGAGSQLSGRERAEYHYVERDLRNIGILTAIMVVLLIGAWAAFTALGVTG
jgi:hypothetical protein